MVTKHPRSGGAQEPPLPWDAGMACLILTSAILEQHQSAFFPPFLVLPYFLMSLIFLVSHW